MVLLISPALFFCKIYTVVIFFFAEKSDRQTRGQSFRGHYRGRGRSTGRGRGGSQQRSFPHPRSHLLDDDEDIDMDGGRHRSVSR